nr:hypothetical protein [uncultured Holophaga sp.]
MHSELLIAHPAPLEYRFPEGWEIVCRVFGEQPWEAKKDTRILCAKTECELYHLVVESEKRRGFDCRHKRKRHDA